MCSFPPTECSVDVTQMDVQQSTLHSVLGIAWDVVSDSFVIKVSLPEIDFTKHGIAANVGRL